MKNLTLENIANACHGLYFGHPEDANVEVEDVVIDSRNVKKGSLFVAIKGERVDGHSFVKEVYAANAAAVVSEQPLEGYAPYILVESTRQALKDIAAFYRNSLDVTVVGITGSVGKTSTKEMIASILETRYRVLKTAGNFNNEIGLPLTIFRLTEEDEVAVLEMGISDFGEMHRLAQIARPDICVITNIGICHLENLGDRDGVFRAKTEIFDHLSGRGIAVLNGDDDKLSAVRKAHGNPPLFYGEGPTNREGKPNFIYASDIRDAGLDGIEMKLHFPQQQELDAHIPLPGRHHVWNALAGACVGWQLGLSAEEICRGIGQARTIDGRMHLIRKENALIIDDCYNANPVSMRAALDLLAQGRGRRIAVLGDMGELGKEETKLHYELGAYAAKKQLDALFCCGTLAREMARGAKEQNSSCEIFYFANKDDLKKALAGYWKTGDTILVKASHFMDFATIVHFLQASVP